MKRNETNLVKGGHPPMQYIIKDVALTIITITNHSLVIQREYFYYYYGPKTKQSQMFEARRSSVTVEVFLEFAEVLVHCVG